MTSGQRNVLVVASGLLLAVVAATTNRLLDDDHADGGWFMYAPNSGATFSPSGSGSAATMRAAAVWCVAIGLWAALSWVLHRARPRDGERGDQAR